MNPNDPMIYTTSNPAWFLRSHSTSNTTYTLVHTATWFATLQDAVANVVDAISALNAALEALPQSGGTT